MGRQTAREARDCPDVASNPLPTNASASVGGLTWTTDACIGTSANCLSPDFTRFDTNPGWDVTWLKELGNLMAPETAVSAAAQDVVWPDEGSSCPARPRRR